MVKSSKKCLICGDEFTPRRKDSVSCSTEKIKECPVCGNSFSYICNSRGFKECCSIKCAAKNPERVKKTKETVLKKYGVSTVLNLPEIREKALKEASSENTIRKKKEIFLERYGVDNPAKNPEVKEKIRDTQSSQNGGKFAFNGDRQRETMAERYGGPSPMYSPEVREKVFKTQRERNSGKLSFNTEKQRQSMIEKYGGPGRLSSPEEMAIQMNTMRERYGVSTPCEYPEFKQKALDYIVANGGELFGGNSVISKMNRKIAETIEKNFSVKVEFEKHLDGKFFDLFIPERNLLIEINPTVTHNSTTPFACLISGCGGECSRHSPLEKGYHQNKSVIARKNNLNLIHIFDWNTEGDLLKLLDSRLISKPIKISAHKCSVRKIPQRDANGFLKDYHIQGASKGQSDCYGLFSSHGDLLAVATFGKPRYNRNFEYEWIRYSVCKGYRIHGGAQKLFSRFVKDVSPVSVISYVDFNHTTRKTFLDYMGFSMDGYSSPSLVWNRISDNRTVSQSSVNLIGADRILGTSYGSVKYSGLTNEDILLKEDFVKVYTSGNLLYSWSC